MFLYRQLLKHFSLNCYFRRYFPWCYDLFLYDFQWTKQLTATPLQDMKSQSEFYLDFCLVPRPHYFALPKRFGSRGPSENVSRPFASDTSPKWIDREGLGKRRTGTRQPWLDISYIHKTGASKTASTTGLAKAQRENPHNTVLGHTLIITKENEDTPAAFAGSNQGEREGIYICVERQLKPKLSRNRLN